MKDDNTNECSNCYAPLRENETDTCDRCKADSGWYNDNAVCNPKTDKMDYRKIKITCPFCGRTFAALLSKFTKPIRHFWLDFDCECPAVEMESFCRKCGSKFTFKMSCG